MITADTIPGNMNGSLTKDSRLNHREFRNAYDIIRNNFFVFSCLCGKIINARGTDPATQKP